MDDTRQRISRSRRASFRRCWPELFPLLPSADPEPVFCWRIDDIRTFEKSRATKPQIPLRRPYTPPGGYAGTADLEPAAGDQPPPQRGPDERLGDTGQTGTKHPAATLTETKDSQGFVAPKNSREGGRGSGELPRAANSVRAKLATSGAGKTPTFAPVVRSAKIVVEELCIVYLTNCKARDTLRT